MKIEEEVKKMRHDLGMSQHALGEKLGRNRDHIKDIECGRKRLSAEDYLKIKELANGAVTSKRKKRGASSP
jgi:transcriptional regulator with XRE-family HTH domain